MNKKISVFECEKNIKDLEETGRKYILTIIMLKKRWHGNCFLKFT